MHFSRRRSGLLLLFFLAALFALPAETIRIGGKRIRDPRSIPGQVSIISQDEIESIAPRSLGEILDTVTGIEIQHQGGLSEPAYVSIRGSSAEQVLILVNGRRLNTAQGGGVDLNSISPEQIERIEILRGAGALQYGQGALGGVVNLVLKNEPAEELSGTVYGKYGSFQNLEGGGNLSFPMNHLPFSLRTSMAAGSIDGAYPYSRSLDSQTLTRENTNRWFLDAAASWEWASNENWKLSGEASSHQEEKGVPGTVEFPTPRARMEDRRSLAAAGFEYSGEIIDWSADISWLGQERYYSDPDYFLGALEDQHQNQALIFQLEGETSFTGKKQNLSLNWGISGRRDSLDSTALSLEDGAEATGRAVRLEGSLYLLNQWDIGQFPDSETARISLLPSVRVDAYSLDAPGDIPDSREQSYSWNMGLMVPSGPREKLLFKANGGRSYRIPDFDDLFWSSSSFAVGNPSLLPEVQLYADVGLLYQPKQNLSMELVVFHHQIKQLILWDLGPGGLWTPRNIGKAQMQGIEAEIRLLKELSFLSCSAEYGMNGNWLHPLDKSEDSVTYNYFLPRKALGQVNAFITLNFYGGASFRLEGHYTGMRYLTAANTKWLDSYWVINLSGEYPLGSHWRFSGNIQNLLNRSYVDIRDYPVPGIQGSLGIRYIMGGES